MLSSDGRCKTFDGNANGYARAEGVSAVCLNAPASASEGSTAGAMASCSGSDKLAAGLLACGARADGKRASLTAPNGTERARLLGMLSAAAGGRPMRALEAHGTGTPLGDPTEAGALAAVHSGPAAGLALGAAKASVGHSEAASGQVGLLVLQRLLGESAAAGNARLRALNPLVGERLGGASTCVVLPTQVVQLESMRTHFHGCPCCYLLPC